MKRTILFVAANPTGTSDLALGEECAAVEHELRLTDGRDDFDFRSKWAVGVDELMRHLLHLKPTVLHFSGHGAPSTTEGAAHHTTTSCGDIASPRGAGILLQESDGAQYVEHRVLAKMIASVETLPRLVVLNACYSTAVAEVLREVVDCVVGIDGAIEDTTARKFAVGFYRAIGYHFAVGKAVEHAAATLYGKQLPGGIVTCHTRRGIDAKRLYLSGPEVTVPPPRGEPSRDADTLVLAPLRTDVHDDNIATAQSRSGGWATLPDLPVHRPRDADPAPTQRTGSGAWPAADAPHDLFVATPATNRATASALCDLLEPHVRVCLPRRSPTQNDHLEQSPTTQRRSRATVLLIWPQTEPTWYLGDDIVTALAQLRAIPDAHQIVPVLFGTGISLPRCLRNVGAIVAPNGDLSSVAVTLRELVAALPQTADRQSPVSLPPIRDPRAGRDRFLLYSRLCQLTITTFDAIMRSTEIAGDAVAPRTAAVANRALDVALLAALDPALCQRLSTELDRRAPWTRPSTRL